MSKGRNTSQRDRDRRRIAATKANCHICGLPIDYTLKTPHPMSFEADHVKAYSKGGADDLSNKRASHRQCNLAKKARDYAPIIRRSGSLE
jgi:5-methylcytosine-specific restriction endonuclease McrA